MHQIEGKRLIDGGSSGSQLLSAFPPSTAQLFQLHALALLRNAVLRKGKLCHVGSPIISQPRPAHRQARFTPETLCTALSRCCTRCFFGWQLPQRSCESRAVDVTPPDRNFSHAITFAPC